MAIPVIPEFEVNTGKSLDSKQFDFHFSAKLARTLAETLYDYKIEAVIREYSTNITDSHSDAGKPELKGYVHLPTKLFPIVKFQDFGLGMTLETIFNVYTKFGLSTKEGDNTTNGSLGYGSKAAFSISDQFTVISCKDGVKTTVICYKDKQGLPTADLKSQVETDAEDGTIVEIPVDINRVDEWHSNAAKVLGCFRVPHEVNTFGKYRDIYQETLSLCKEVREKGSVFRYKNTFQHRSTSLVLMGDVAYHIPNITQFVPNISHSEHIKNALLSGLYVASFDIGDLDHSPSRESISYDPTTLSKIRNKVVKDILREVRSIKEKLNDNKMESLYLFLRNPEIEDGLMYSVVKELRFPFTENMPLYLVDTYTKHGHWNPRKFKPLHLVNGLGTIRGYVKNTLGWYSRSSSVYNMTQDRLLGLENIKVIYSDKEKGFYKVLDTLDNAHNTLGGNVLCVNTLEEANILADWFGISKENIICGDVYSPEKVIRKGGNKRTSYGIESDSETVASVLELNSSGGYTLTTCKVDLKEDGVYWIDREDKGIEVSGLVPNITTSFGIGGYTLSGLLRSVGGKKLVFRNMNNKGKIERSGIPKLESEVANKVKSFKKELVKYLIWNNNPLEDNLCGKEKLIAVKFPETRKLQEKIVTPEEVPREVVQLASLSNWGLPETKMFKRQKELKSEMSSKVKIKVEGAVSKLPLYSKFSSWGEDLDNFKYYLKLEKVIK